MLYCYKMICYNMLQCYKCYKMLQLKNVTLKHEETTTETGK